MFSRFLRYKEPLEDKDCASFVSAVPGKRQILINIEKMSMCFEGISLLFLFFYFHFLKPMVPLYIFKN